MRSIKKKVVALAGAAAAAAIVSFGGVNPAQASEGLQEFIDFDSGCPLGCPEDAVCCSTTLDPIIVIVEAA